ncbi:MAG: TIGR03545 family protein [Spirochaetales bacterium]|nr:TIGR03545 family protein [Spirochaetales bacterium]
MGKKLPKPPKLFLKQYKEKDFNAKILSRTFMEKDKELLLSLFNKDKENIYSIKSGYSKDDVKQLKIIAKAIKKNTGVVQKGKLIVFLVIIGAALLFNFIFKDSLLRDALEKGMVAVFQAKSAVSGLSFDILGADISISGCVIGDSTKPFKNLIQLGKTEIDLNMTELLKGKFVVTNIECQDIQFGTPRTDSARIAQQGTSPEPGEEQGTPEESKEEFIPDLKGIDTDAIIEKEMSNLKSPGKITEINETLGTMTNKWSDTVTAYEKDIEELGQSIEAVKKIDIKKIKTIPDAEKAYTTINSAAKKATKFKNAITQTQSEIKKDLAYVEAESKQIGASIENDYNYLLSFVKAPEQGAKRIFSSIAEDFLKAQCGEFYTYGMKGLDVIKNLDFGKKKKEKKEKAPPGEGYKIEFPGNAYPNFLIEKASFSIGDTASTDYMSVRLENISSAPELTHKPSTAQVFFKAGTQETSFDGSVDIRKESEEMLSLTFKTSNYPLDLSSGLELLGIRQYSSDATFSTEFKILKENKTLGNIFLSLKNISLSLVDEKNEISRNIKEILTQAQEVTIEAGYSVKDDDSIAINASSNIDKLIADRVGKMIEELIRDAKTMLVNKLDSLLEESLKKNKTLYSAFTEIKSLLDGDVKDVDGFQAVIDGKFKALEAKKKQILKEIEDKAKDTVKDLIPKIGL